MLKSLVLTAALAQVWWPTPACPNCRMVGYVDGLEPRDVPVAAVNAPWVLGAWGFNCYNGEPPDRVDFFYQRDDGYYQSIKNAAVISQISIQRLDVQRAYVRSCTTAPEFAGLELTVNVATVPTGVRGVIFVLWRGGAPITLEYRVRFQ